MAAMARFVVLAVLFAAVSAAKFKDSDKVSRSQSYSVLRSLSTYYRRGLKLKS